MLEKVIHKQFYDYLLKTKVIEPKQPGFRKAHSTTTVVIGVSDHILSEMAKENIVAVLFIDIAKACDFVVHSILLRKPHHYGVQGKEQNGLNHIYLAGTM